ncbi:hypothetical protein GCM10011504_39850 [Siccirubricoccus deserti]|nr:hypothetical protein GCM10011504_39850 [Siccirubricoccus deserti]
MEALDEALARFRQRKSSIPTRAASSPRHALLDNIFIERLWRSLKYECVYLHAFETGAEPRAGLTKWIGYYNAGRPHSAFRADTRGGVWGRRDGEVDGLRTTKTEPI